MLDKRLKKVIQMRLGIGCAPLTQAEIGKKLKVSRERVRQLQNKALKELKECMSQVCDFGYHRDFLYGY